MAGEQYGTDYANEIHYGVQRFAQLYMQAGAVGDLEFKSTDPLDTAKMDHRHAKVAAQNGSVTSTSQRMVIHVARAAGTVSGFVAGTRVAATAGSTVSVDLVKNGTTVLSAALSITSALAAYALLTGVISSGAYVVGDVFEVVFTVAGGAPGSGAFGQAVFNEDPA